MSVPDPAAVDWVPVWQVASNQVLDSQLPDRLKTADGAPLATDLNNIYSPGFYRWTTTTLNTPVAGSYGYLIVAAISDASHQARQIAWLFNTDAQYQRYNGGGTWTSWIRMWPLSEALPGGGGKHALPLIGGWVNYGQGYPAATYWKDATGMVHMEGLIMQSVQNGSIATVPVGYRPVGPTGSASVMFPATSNGPPGPTGLVLVDLRVGADGNMVCSGPFGSGWLSIASVHYDSGSIP